MAAEVLGWHHAQAGAVWAQGRAGSCPGPRHTHLTQLTLRPGLGWAGAGDTKDLQGKVTPSSFYPMLVLGRFLPFNCWAGVWQHLRSHSISPGNKRSSSSSSSSRLVLACAQFPGRRRRD